MKVRETRLPGTGSRYTLTFPGGSYFTIFLHNDGTCETYWSDDADGESERLFELTKPEARKVAEIFDGTYFEPIPDDIESVFEDARIRWLTVPSTSRLDGRTLQEEGIRSKTGASVLAIQRGQKTISNPAPDTELRADDVLVVVGSEDAHSALERLIRDGE